MKTNAINLKSYRNIVSSIRIDHEAFAMIREEVEGAYEDVTPEGFPVCLLIIGESRTGKSCVVRQVLDQYAPDEGDDQSVLYAVAPAKATLKSLLEALLKGLGDPYWSRGTESNMTQRLYTQLEQVNCRMIILDEFQHLCDKGQAKQLDILADWLKVLLENGHWGLVAVGLPESASIVNCHSQLAGRFEPLLRMPTFDWTDKMSRSQFKGILKRFRLEMAPFELPLIEDEQLAFRMYLATAGRVGLIAKLLDRAVRDAIRAKRLQIRFADLQAAYGRAIWASSWFPVKDGPFLADQASISGSEVLKAVLERAKHEQVADTSGAVEIHTSPTGSSTEKQKNTRRPERHSHSYPAPGRMRAKARLKPPVTRGVRRGMERMS